ncbi:MAG TPA: S9 family peptidase [Acidobacteriaceae bacterium]|nr:S9 family peptidase [Acidobacteriaceae bacterium]
MKRGRFAAIVLLGFLFSLAAAAQARRPMTFNDLMAMRRLGDISVSPDSRWVMYSATDVDLAKNSKTSHLWIVPTAGGPARALTDSLAGESRGRFSPDGKRILFESTREGVQQIWLADFNTANGTIGDPHPLTSISTGADGAMWSPDSRNILLVSKVYPDCRDDACNQQRDKEREQSKVKARIFTHLLYRHWNHFTGDKRSHLFLVSADGGTPRDLTPGEEHDVPPFQLEGPDQYGFSPDGKEIAYEEKPVSDPAVSTNIDIFTLRLDDPNARPVKVSTSPGGDHSPRYSPDGRYIAWRSQARAGYESDRFRLVLYDRETRQIRDILPKFDRWVDEFTWAPDSRTIYFAYGDEGDERVGSVQINGSDFVRYTRRGEYGDLHLTPDGKLLIAAKMTMRMPGEVYALKVSEKRVAPAPGRVASTLPAFAVAPERQLSHLNDALLDQLDMQPMQAFWFPSIGRVKVQGFIIKPPNFDPAKKYPVKFLIHGGPQGAWGEGWSYRWNAELFAANGYVVVMINPRGSTGYGQAFIDGVNGDWGGRPYVDLMRGLDYAEQHYPFIDKTRECALGASYGGYMADWILGHTHRFRCIVSHDGMFDTESAYNTTEELWFMEWEFKGTPWTNRAMYRRWSPMLAAPNFKTPTLVIHSQLDYRLDVSQGYALFDTLQRLGVPSKMLYFPDEGHWILKPQNSQLWYKTVNDWVDEWTR